MRFIMDEFIGAGNTRKLMKYALIKQNNGDFRIKRGTQIISRHSLKSAATERFEELKKYLEVK